MDRIAGTAARQLVLGDEQNAPLLWQEGRRRPVARFRLLQKDVYAELTRRRRRAQIAARRLLDQP